MCEENRSRVELHWSLASRNESRNEAASKTILYFTFTFHNDSTKFMNEVKSLGTQVPKKRMGRRSSRPNEGEGVDMDTSPIHRGYGCRTGETSSAG